jgi:ankyrin repeat protein
MMTLSTLVIGTNTSGRQTLTRQISSQTTHSDAKNLTSISENTGSRFQPYITSTAAAAWWHACSTPHIIEADEHRFLFETNLTSQNFVLQQCSRILFVVSCHGNWLQIYRSVAKLRALTTCRRGLQQPGPDTDTDTDTDTDVDTPPQTTIALVCVPSLVHREYFGSHAHISECKVRYIKAFAAQLKLPFIVLNTSAAGRLRLSHITLQSVYKWDLLCHHSMRLNADMTSLDAEDALPRLLSKQQKHISPWTAVKVPLHASNAVFDSAHVQWCHYREQALSQNDSNHIAMALSAATQPSWRTPTHTRTHTHAHARALARARARVRARPRTNYDTEVIAQTTPIAVGMVCDPQLWYEFLRSVVTRHAWQIVDDNCIGLDMNECAVQVPTVRMRVAVPFSSGMQRTVRFHLFTQAQYATGMLMSSTCLPPDFMPRRWLYSVDLHDSTACENLWTVLAHVESQRFRDLAPAATAALMVVAMSSVSLTTNHIQLQQLRHKFDVRMQAASARAQSRTQRTVEWMHIDASVAHTSNHVWSRCFRKLLAAGHALRVPIPCSAQPKHTAADLLAIKCLKRNALDYNTTSYALLDHLVLSLVDDADPQMQLSPFMWTMIVHHTIAFNRLHVLTLLVQSRKISPNMKVPHPHARLVSDSTCAVPIPLLCAVLDCPWESTPELCTLLLQHGADANATIPSRESALALACRGGFPSVVEQLLTHGADTSMHKSEWLHPMKLHIDTISSIDDAYWLCSPLSEACTLFVLHGDPKYLQCIEILLEYSSKTASTHLRDTVAQRLMCHELQPNWLLLLSFPLDAATLVTSRIRCVFRVLFVRWLHPLVCKSAPSFNTSNWSIQQSSNKWIAQLCACYRMRQRYSGPASACSTSLNSLAAGLADTGAHVVEPELSQLASLVSRVSSVQSSSDNNQIDDACDTICEAFRHGLLHMATRKLLSVCHSWTSQDLQSSIINTLERMYANSINVDLEFIVKLVTHLPWDVLHVASRDGVHICNPAAASFWNMLLPAIVHRATPKVIESVVQSLLVRLSVADCVKDDHALSMMVDTVLISFVEQPSCSADALTQSLAQPPQLLLAFQRYVSQCRGGETLDFGQYSDMIGCFVRYNLPRMCKHVLQCVQHVDNDVNCVLQQDCCFCCCGTMCPIPFAIQHRFHQIVYVLLEFASDAESFATALRPCLHTGWEHPPYALVSPLTFCILHREADLSCAIVDRGLLLLDRISSLARSERNPDASVTNRNMHGLHSQTAELATLQDPVHHQHTLLQLFVQCGECLQYQSCSPLLWAAQHSGHVFVSHMLARGIVSVHEPSIAQHSALLAAVLANDFAMVQLLCSFGACDRRQPSQVVANQMHCLSVAACHPPAMQTLLKLHTNTHNVLATTRVKLMQASHAAESKRHSAAFVQLSHIDPSVLCKFQVAPRFSDMYEILPFKPSCLHVFASIPAELMHVMKSDMLRTVVDHAEELLRWADAFIASPPLCSMHTQHGVVLDAIDKVYAAEGNVLRAVPPVGTAPWQEVFRHAEARDNEREKCVESIQGVISAIQHDVSAISQWLELQRIAANPPNLQPLDQFSVAQVQLLATVASHLHVHHSHAFPSLPTLLTHTFHAIVDTIRCVSELQRREYIARLRLHVQHSREMETIGELLTEHKLALNNEEESTSMEMHESRDEELATMAAVLRTASSVEQQMYSLIPEVERATLLPALVDQYRRLWTSLRTAMANDLASQYAVISAPENSVAMRSRHHHIHELRKRLELVAHMVIPFAQSGCHEAVLSMFHDTPLVAVFDCWFEMQTEFSHDWTQKCAVWHRLFACGSFFWMQGIDDRFVTLDARTDSVQIHAVSGHVCSDSHHPEVSSSSCCVLARPFAHAWQHLLSTSTGYVLTALRSSSMLPESPLHQQPACGHAVYLIQLACLQQVHSLRLQVLRLLMQVSLHSKSWPAYLLPIRSLSLDPCLDQLDVAYKLRTIQAHAGRIRSATVVVEVPALVVSGIMHWIRRFREYRRWYLLDSYRYWRLSLEIRRVIRQIALGVQTLHEELGIVLGKLTDEAIGFLPDGRVQLGGYFFPHSSAANEEDDVQQIVALAKSTWHAVMHSNLDDMFDLVPFASITDLLQHTFCSEVEVLLEQCKSAVSSELMYCWL